LLAASFASGSFALAEFLTWPVAFGKEISPFLLKLSMIVDLENMC
jgi:hypothetical protein